MHLPISSNRAFHRRGAQDFEPVRIQPRILRPSGLRLRTLTDSPFITDNPLLAKRLSVAMQKDVPAKKAEEAPAAIEEKAEARTFLEKTGKFAIKAGKAALNFGLGLVYPAIVVAKYAAKPKTIWEDVKHIRTKFAEAKDAAKIILSCLLISEAVNVAILPFAGWLLARAGLSVPGIGGGAIVSDTITAIIAFQIAYFAKAWKYYKFKFGKNVRAILNAESDLLKLHIWAIGASLGPYAFSFLTLWGTAAGTNSLAAGFAGVTLAVALSEVVYFATISVLSMAIYKRLKELIDYYKKA
ncbi:MAG: hypothetical protein WC717_01580 [Candidatus Micrarchaeia archaeon]|jgi:hypothetical protein